jgi:hypothetical protein
VLGKQVPEVCTKCSEESVKSSGELQVMQN